MSAVAEAERVVRRARGRLVRDAAVDGAARGALAGALGALAVAGAAASVGGDAPLGVLVTPPAFAVAGALYALRRVPGDAAAALALDRAAATDEAFVTAVTARDAAPWARELTAERAVGRCGAAQVARFLPFAAPGLAAAAAVATGLLAAVVLVPRAAPGAAPGGAPAAVELRPGRAPGPAPGAAETASPRDRAARLAAAVEAGGDPPATLRDAVRGDLGAVPEPDLRRLAEALAAGGSDDARRALDALARGARDEAVAALRAALGAGDLGASGATAGGDAPGAVPAARPSARPPQSAGTWPLRYDAAVRRYLEESR